jgi:hypothetical protein
LTFSSLQVLWLEVNFFEISFIHVPIGKMSYRIIGIKLRYVNVRPQQLRMGRNGGTRTVSSGPCSVSSASEQKTGRKFSAAVLQTNSFAAPLGSLTRGRPSTHLSHPTISATKQCNGSCCAVVPTKERSSCAQEARTGSEPSCPGSREKYFRRVSPVAGQNKQSNRLFTSAASELCELKHHHLPLLSNSFETKFGYPLPVQISSLINL